MTAEAVPYLTEQQYLEAESRAETKSEYFDGVMYAMAGASDPHELVSMNFAGALLNHLRGKGCRVFKSDMKVRMTFLEKPFYRYPDVFVACDPADNHRLYRERPKLLIEVLSNDWDDGAMAKFIGYRSIQTVEEIVFADPNAEAPIVYISRRAEGWEPVEIVRGTESRFTLRSVGLEMSVADLFVV
ncbi:MAG TPA: Uma2 family endonuclease [Chthoniobacteraceae bacterium]|jgi:Uma2 family endonuclease|nr:Uma2 family endonuclease [Chthoniobacteraceae bacterium]